MLRRSFHRNFFLSCTTLVSPLAWGRPAVTAREGDPWQAIETASQGRLGVAVLDVASGAFSGNRLDERFPMCSTFKWLAAAQVLQRVDQGHEQLKRRVRFGKEVLLPWSPVTEQHVDDGMTVGELCQAAVAMSDNAAGNLLLQSLGGPRGLTRFAREQGDSVTRLDRWEPQLNESTPGDPRDTSSPRAMAGLLQRLVVGQALSRGSREQLAQWLRDTKTNAQRLGAGLPALWRVGSKTGTGPHGSTNDVGVYWREGRPPIVVVAFLTESAASLAVRETAIAQVAKAVFALGGG